jgi:hypothetical protein
MGWACVMYRGENDTGLWWGNLMERDHLEDEIFALLVCYVAQIGSYLKSVVFWVITRRRVVIVCRCFGTTYRSHLHG